MGGDQDSFVVQQGMIGWGRFGAEHIQELTRVYEALVSPATDSEQTIPAADSEDAA